MIMSSDEDSCFSTASLRGGKWVIDARGFLSCPASQLVEHGVIKVGTFVLIGSRRTAEKNQDSTSGEASRHPRHHHRGSRHRHQHGGQAPGKLHSGVPKPVLIGEPCVEATPELDGTGLQVGVISTRGYVEVVDALATTCCSELLLKGVESHNLHIAQVALPTELPYATKQLIRAAPVRLDAMVVVGCLVEGDPLFAAADAVANACMAVGVETKTPVIYGVLKCTDTTQARQCAGLTPKARSFGVEWAQTAISMAWLSRDGSKK